MFGKSGRMFLVLLLLAAAGSAGAKTLLHWTFDGPLREKMVTAADVASQVTIKTFVNKGLRAPEAAIIYGPANPWYNKQGTSAHFQNPTDVSFGTAAMFANDPGPDSVLDLSKLKAFTIEAFICVHSLRLKNVVVRKYGGGRYYLEVTNDGNLRFAINDDDKAAQTGPGTIQLNKWHHIAGVFDESDTAAPMRIYVDSRLAGTAPHKQRVEDSERSLGIGAMIRDNADPPQDADDFFDGFIDELRISDTALSPDEFLNASATRVSFESESSEAAESVTPAVLTVRLYGKPKETVTVDYAVVGGTAAAGEDYVLDAGKLTFKPGESSKNISLDIRDDDLIEEDETITVGLINPRGADSELGAISQHTYKIIDASIKISFDAEYSRGSEGVPAGPISVSLSRAGSETITAAYAASGGTATGDGVDYRLINGTLTFNPGETTKTISGIEVINDDLDEDNETIVIALANPTNAALGQRRQHTYTILRQFDGLHWYHSADSSLLGLTDSGELEWKVREGHQIMVRLPEQRFSQPGDVVTFSYVWSSTSPEDYGCECYKDHDPDPNIYRYCSDVRCVGGTGDFRVGLFDSNEHGHIPADGIGKENEIYRGYLGYHFRFFPHVPQDAPLRFTEYKTGGGKESHTNTSIWERNRPMKNDSLLSNSNSWKRLGQPMIGGLGLPLGGSSLLTLRLERVSGTTARISISCNGKTWSRESETPGAIPDKIDAFGMWSQHGVYDYVRLGIPRAPAPAEISAK
ncbi:MAG TPA: Calx-beta domain-containing protein [Sedimentisphaerales bacterium]|nr:Calx-beta domain-containing protein [Sedimentisphaerales bacterium]